MQGRRQRFVGTVLGLVLALGVAGPAMAAQGGMCNICDKAGDQTASYPSKAGYTLVRGAANTLLGWTELIRQPANEVKAGGNVLTGLGKGVGQTVKRTLGGLAEVLTFWTPKVQDSYLHFSDNCPLCMGKGK